jgi:ankyrin repeat protein
MFINAAFIDGYCSYILTLELTLMYMPTLACARDFVQDNNDTMSSEHGWRCIAYACTTASDGADKCRAAYSACYQSAAYDAPNALGETCLHIAARSNNTAAIDWLLHPTTTNATTADAIESESQLVDNNVVCAQGCDVNARYTKGCGSTALHEAVRSSSTDVVQLLLKSGADVRIADTSGETPLHLAARYVNHYC